MTTKHERKPFGVSRISMKLAETVNLLDPISHDPEIKEINEGSGEQGDFVWIYRNPQLKNDYNNIHNMMETSICLTTQQLNAYSKWVYNRYFENTLAKFKRVDFGKQLFADYETFYSKKNNDYKYYYPHPYRTIFDRVYKRSYVLFFEYKDFLGDYLNTIKYGGVYTGNFGKIVNIELMYTLKKGFKRLWKHDGVLTLKLSDSGGDYDALQVVKEGNTEIWPLSTGQSQGTEILPYLIQKNNGPIQVALLPKIETLQDRSYWKALLAGIPLHKAKEIRNNLKHIDTKNLDLFKQFKSIIDEIDIYGDLLDILSSFEIEDKYNSYINLLSIKIYKKVLKELSNRKKIDEKDLKNIYKHHLGTFDPTDFLKVDYYTDSYITMPGVTLTDLELKQKARYLDEIGLPTLHHFVAFVMDTTLNYIHIEPLHPVKNVYVYERDQNEFIDDDKYLAFQRLIKFTYDDGNEKKWLSPKECLVKLHKSKKKIECHVNSY